ncbi:MAG: transposase [bacterium]|nr:transposase [bacterium]
MNVDKDSVLIQRLDVVNTGRRRRWSLDEKLRIVAESYQGSRQVSAVARRHEISRAQLYAWRRALGGGSGGFLPVSVGAASVASLSVEAAASSVPVEIGLSNGACLSVPCSIAPSRLAGIVAVLSKL